MRTSSIRLRAHSRIAVLYEDYLEICDGNMLAAMLLSTLVYWTDVKTAQKDENLWIWKTHEGFQEDLMFDKPGMKPPHRTTISSALDLLKKKDFIEWRKNPKMALDRTRQYLVHLTKVQETIDKLPALESRKSDKGMSENRLSEEQATEASSEQSSNVGKPTMQSRNNDNALSEKRHSNVGKPTSNTSDYSSSDYSPVITGEGTYSASDRQEQPCADAQPAPTDVPYQPNFNADQSRIATTTEDTNGSDNHGPSDHRPATPATASRMDDSAGADRHEQRPQAQGTQASNAQDQGHARGASQQASTAVAPAGGSGYRTPAEAYVGGEVDIKKLSLQAHTDYVFRWLDAIRQEAKRDSRVGYVKNKTSEGLIRDLITSCWNTDKELTEENVRKAWRQMWNEPTWSNGFSWKKRGITINAFQNNYGEYLEKAWDEEAKQQTRTAPSAPAPLPTASTPTVSGLPRWVPPSATAYAN